MFPDWISTHALTWSATNPSLETILPSLNFNSRTHVECDVQIREQRGQLEISTHALTWSATGSKEQFETLGYISTHALTWSATRGGESPHTPRQFQLTHSRGVRL